MDIIVKILKRYTTGTPTIVSPPSNDPAVYIDKSVDDNEKIRILNNKWVPPANFNFAITAGQKKPTVGK